VAKTGKTEPRVVVIAGPNGAGKSTIAARLLHGPLQVRHYVNADVIARGLSEFHSEDTAIAAAEIMLTRLRELAEQRQSFAFETTLASRTFASWIKTLFDKSYSFHLIFLWRPNAEMAVRRVRKRVLAGGHGIPLDVIRRRYGRGINNFFELYQPIAANWRVYNNSERKGPVLIASGEFSEKVRIYDSTSWKSFSQWKIT